MLEAEGYRFRGPPRRSPGEFWAKATAVQAGDLVSAIRITVAKENDERRHLEEGREAEGKDVSIDPHDPDGLDHVRQRALVRRKKEHGAKEAQQDQAPWHGRVA